MQDISDFNVNYSLELINSIETLINAIALDPIAICKIVALLSNETFTAIQKMPYIQLKRYIDGVSKVEDELGNGCKLSEKLFSNPKKRNDNAMRVYKAVTASDTEKKIDYLVDATRSMLLGLIDVEMMFRVFRAVVESLPEDLAYLSSLVEKDGPFNGDIRIHALERTGLMISAGINAQEDIEKQDYHISTLGYAVDRYVLSVNNEKRWNWYKNRRSDDSRIFNGPKAASDEEFNEMMEKLFDKKEKDLIEAAKPQWDYFGGREENVDKIALISQKKEAISLLIFATKAEGRLFIKNDILHYNPYVEIGNFELPDNDDARNSAVWIGAVKVLEETGMLECVDYMDETYKLTDDGWNNAEIYIDKNGIGEEEMCDPNTLLKFLMD